MEDIFKKLAAAGAASFADALIKDIVEIATTKTPNLEATARIVAHIGVAHALIEILAGQGIPAPENALVEMGRALGREEGKKMVAELKFIGDSVKTDKVDGSNPEVKNSWRAQL
jgi:hypothetical protein